MDYKKTNAPTNTVTRDMIAMAEQTGNVYETVCIIGKRANQIAIEMKKGLEKKLQEFASTDNNEEMAENREQIEISRFYEKLPKPTARHSAAPHRYAGVCGAQTVLHESAEGERPS